MAATLARRRDLFISVSFPIPYDCSLARLQLGLELLLLTSVFLLQVDWVLRRKLGGASSIAPSSPSACAISSIACALMACPAPWPRNLPQRSWISAASAAEHGHGGALPREPWMRGSIIRGAWRLPSRMCGDLAM